MSQPSIVFLMYHEVEIPDRTLCRRDAGYLRYVLTSSEFQSQIEYLRANGYRGLSVSEAMKFSEGRNVAITFDDGSETDLMAAAPILRQAGFGATFYLTVSWLGQPGYLSASQVRELVRQGFEIGCHSMTHAYLTRLDEKDLQREIADAKVQVEQIAQTQVHHFSCPGGRYDQRVARVARAAGYRTVSTSRIQENSADTDPFALGRVAILRGIPMAAFANICNGEALTRLRIKGGLVNASKRVLGDLLYDRVRGILLGRPDSTL